MKATPSTLPVLLVVDDDELVVDGLEATFEDDFQVLTAGSAERARELVAQHCIDIVISDDRLPQESGVSFLGWLAQEQPLAVRILLTGFFSEPGDVRRAISQGRMWHYMRKPWEAGSMENIVNRALESKQQAEALLEADRRYRGLFGSVPTPLFIADLQGQGRTWNPAFSELLQDWPGAGLSIAERLPAGAWASLVERLKEGAEETSEALGLQAGGEEIFVHLTLRLDAADEVTGILRPSQGKADSTQPIPQSSGCCVLVLDSNLSQRRLLRRAVERGAHEVREAAGLADALALLTQGRCGLVLLQGEVQEVAWAQAILEANPEQTLLFCTPDADHPAVQALATRGVAILAMPYSLNALLDAVREQLPD